MQPTHVTGVAGWGCQAGNAYRNAVAVKRRMYKTLSYTADKTTHHLQGGPKRKPDYYSNNFGYCQPTFIMFGTYTM